MKTTQVLYWVMILSIILSVFVEKHLIFILIAVASLAVGLRTFLQDKKELKLALNYTRIKNKTHLGRIALLIVISILIFIGTYLVLNIFKIELTQNGTSFYHIFILFALSLSSYYGNYIGSIRSFESGLKLPGRKQEIIDWNGIDNLIREETLVKIETNQNLHIYSVDNRDFNDFDSTIETWRERCL